MLPIFCKIVGLADLIQFQSGGQMCHTLEGSDVTVLSTYVRLKSFKKSICN
jgi:hypothetical protein